MNFNALAVFSELKNCKLLILCGLLFFECFHSMNMAAINF